MFDIITFGSATRDIFLKSKDFKVAGQKKIFTRAAAKGEEDLSSSSERGFSLSLGLKINVDGIYFYSGGGGTNTAATFVKQGFKTAFCGLVGKDEAGEKIIKELKERGINSGFVSMTGKKPTNHSIILSLNGRERTILAYRGASGELSKKDIPWQKLKAKWLYLAPLSGRAVPLFEDLVDFAKKKKMKIAANPGNSQLSLPEKKLTGILKKIDVLILNQEEASLLAGLPANKEKEIFRKIDELCPGIAIMTKGSAGAVVSDGQYLYRAPALKTKEIEVTGAGDSFASGFVSGLIKKNGDVEYAVQLAVANASACLKKIGAKNGLLSAGRKFKKVRVAKEKLLPDNL